MTLGLAWRSLRPWRSRPVGPRDTRRRFFVAQALYAFGALLGVTSTYLGIAFIVLVQLNFAVAPRIRLLSRF